MKKLLLTFSVLLCFLSASSQRSADVGVRIGAAVYWGDLEKVSYLKEITPLYGILGRWNFNSRMAVRGQLISGQLKSSGTFPGVNLGEPNTRVTRDEANGMPYESFIKKSDDSYNFIRSVQTFEALFEFNFLEYKMGSTTKFRFTPFLSLGVGVFYSRAPRRGTLVLIPKVVQTNDPANPLFYNQQSMVPYKTLYKPVLDGNMNKTNDLETLSPIIPVGFGFKYNLTKTLGMCAELCIRKTFTDKIDNLDDPQRFQNADPFADAYPASFTPNVIINNDWYASLNISLHWQLWADRGICKVNEKKEKKARQTP